MHMGMIMCKAHNKNGPGGITSLQQVKAWSGHILCTHHPYIQTERTVCRIDERFNTFHLFEMKIKRVSVNCGYKFTLEIYIWNMNY